MNIAPIPYTPNELNNLPFLGFLKWIWPFAILDLILKGFALWRATKRNENMWFIALLVVNSLGILPAIYLLTHPEVKKNKK